MNIYDPRKWDNLNKKLRESLVQKGPVRDFLVEKCTQHKPSVGFSSEFYTRVLRNGEKQDREWLVYSKEAHKVYCFCCKLFKKCPDEILEDWKRLNALFQFGPQDSQLANEGCSDWENLGVLIREHERSMVHIFHMITWHGLRCRLRKDERMDKVDDALFKREKEHWRSVLLRMLSVVKFLAVENRTFLGTVESMEQDDYGNLSSLVEAIAEFDPVLREHIRRIESNEIRHHYLGRKVQGLTTLLASEVKSAIQRKIKEAKYFSVIVDCALDAGSENQMFLILRCVDVSALPVKVDEYFLGFLNMNDTSEHGPFEETHNVLKSLDLDIDDVRGQGYGVRSLMKGRAQVIQENISDINPRALYTPWGCRSLNNLRYGGLFQFSLEQSVTHWESHIESIKAIRFHVSDIREALLDVAETEVDLFVRSHANSLADYGLEFEFLVGMIIWFDVLSAVDSVSKYLESKDLRIDVAIDEVKTLIRFFEKYRETGFTQALIVAKEIATEMKIDLEFQEEREVRRKKRLGKIVEESSPESFEESFRVECILYTMDNILGLLKKSLEQYQTYEDNFGFLFCSEKLNSLEEIQLKTSCHHLEMFLNQGKFGGIDGDSLFQELKHLREKLPRENMSAIDILDFLKRMNCFPYACIAYRILLTIPVIFTSTRSGFSKLEVLKSYLRLPVSQESLDGLALISIEKGFLGELDYEMLVDDCK